jgi:hypothetical protein
MLNLLASFLVVIPMVFHSPRVDVQGKFSSIPAGWEGRTVQVCLASFWQVDPKSESGFFVLQYGKSPCTQMNPDGSFRFEDVVSAKYCIIGLISEFELASVRNEWGRTKVFWLRDEEPLPPMSLMLYLPIGAHAGVTP